MVCFPCFCVNCLPMFYFVYFTNCALKDVNGACYCTCSLVALRAPEMCFWPAKTRKNLELFEIHTCLWPGAQIWFRHEWKNLEAASLLLHCIDRYSHWRYWNGFFSALFHVLDWSFLLHFDGKLCNWILKVIWPRMDWFWVFFCCEMAFFVDFISVWTEVCKNCSFVVLFRRHQIFSMFSLRGILVCSLKMLVLFAVGFCNIDW